ncbi:unnamed protein product [Lactuca saligna]|uniref:F-box domain-containing protein n=1 Tax=Lactuca saligna TaxID=75948 RepID=A0AA35Z7N6_LACSI|nr:unnamed protein product [Lactuca saligna]
MYTFPTIEFCSYSWETRALLPLATMKMFEEGQNQPKNAEKRIKCQENTEKGDEDGISALPDGLLLEILSRLPYTKDAIRTDHHRRCECFQNPNSIYDFARLVEKTLTQCRQLKLKKFKLHSYYAIRFESQFNNWIRHAINCNVEELDLEFLYSDRDAEFRLDQSIFNNSCFTDLKLAGCMLNPSGAISWKNLKSLYISYLMLDEDLIVNILSGSPLLETLVLEGFDGYRGIEISSYDEFEDDIIKINAPQLKKLKKFEASSEFDIKLELQLNSWICYVIRCNVKEIILRLSTNKLESESDFMLDQTLFTCSCLTDLTLDLCTCMVIPAGAISWKNLRNLCISYGSLDEGLIEIILSGSPVLETLELNLCYGYRRLNITSKSVKNLVISKYWNYLNSYDVSASDADLDRYLDYCIGSEADIDIDIIEINAPNIQSLRIQQEIELVKLLLVDVSSLVKANLNYTAPKKVEEEMLKGFIMKLGHVKELKIGILCSEVVTCLQDKGFVFPSNVKFPEE